MSPLLKFHKYRANSDTFVSLEKMGTLEHNGVVGVAE